MSAQTFPAAIALSPVEQYLAGALHAGLCPPTAWPSPTGPTCRPSASATTTGRWATTFRTTREEALSLWCTLRAKASGPGHLSGWRHQAPASSGVGVRVWLI